MLALASDGKLPGGKNIETVELAPFLDQIPPWFHGDEFPVAGEGGAGLIAEVFRDARGGEDDVGERVRHPTILGV